MSQREGSEPKKDFGTCVRYLLTKRLLLCSAHTGGVLTHHRLCVAAEGHFLVGAKRPLRQYGMTAGLMVFMMMRRPSADGQAPPLPRSWAKDVLVCHLRSGLLKVPSLFVHLVWMVVGGCPPQHTSMISSPFMKMKQIDTKQKIAVVVGVDI